METINKEWLNLYGYKPSIYELYELYSSGCLNLTDNEENILLVEFEKIEGLH